MDRHEARERYKQADALYRRRKYAEALAILDELDQAMPPMKSLLFVRALCLARLRRNHEAIEVCDQLSATFGDPRADELRARLDAAIASRRRARQEEISKSSAPAEDLPSPDHAEPAHAAPPAECPWDAATPVPEDVTPMPDECLTEGPPSAEDAPQAAHPAESEAPAAEPPPAGEPPRAAGEQAEPEEPHLDFVEHDVHEPPVIEAVEPSPPEEPAMEAAEPLREAALPESTAEGTVLMVSTRAIGLAAAGLILAALVAVGAAMAFRHANPGPVAGTVPAVPETAMNAASEPPARQTPSHGALSPETETPPDILAGNALPADAAHEPPDSGEAVPKTAEPPVEPQPAEDAPPETATSEPPAPEAPTTIEEALTPGAAWLMAGEVSVRSSVVTAPGNPPDINEESYFVRIATTVTDNDGEVVRLTHHVEKYPGAPRSGSESDSARGISLSRDTVKQVFALGSPDRGLAASDSALRRPILPEFFLPLLAPSGLTPGQSLKMKTPMRNPMIAGGFDWPGTLKVSVEEAREHAVRVAYAHTVPFRKLKVDDGEVSFEAENSGEVMLAPGTRHEISRKGRQTIRISAPGQTSREEIVEFTLKRGGP